MSPPDIAAPAPSANPAPPPAAPVPLAISTPAEGPAQQRWLDQQREITKSDPFRDPSQLLTRSADGVVTAQPRSPDPAVPGDQTPPGPASVENGHLKVGDLSLSPDEVKGLLERHALESSRKALMPASADGYTLPDVRLPDVQFKWSVDNEVLGPALTQAKQIAFDAGLSQEQFGRFMSVYASSQIHEQLQFARAQAAEVAKLGDLANIRMDSLKTWLSSQLGTEGAKALTETIFTARQVQAYERLMQKFVSGGSASFSRAHHEPPDNPNKISQAEYDKLGYAARLEYASRFRQPGA